MKIERPLIKERRCTYVEPEGLAINILTHPTYKCVIVDSERIKVPISYTKSTDCILIQPENLIINIDPVKH